MLESIYPYACLSICQPKEGQLCICCFNSRYSTIINIYVLSSLLKHDVIQVSIFPDVCLFGRPSISQPVEFHLLADHNSYCVCF